MSIKHKLLSATSPLRIAIDLAWVLSLAVVLVLLLTRDEGRTSLAAGVKLELVPGVQRRGIYDKGGRRLGAVVQRVTRGPNGWRIEQRYRLGDGDEIGHTALDLYNDLSLRSIAVAADPARVMALTGVGPELAAKLSLGQLAVTGRCRMATGECTISGKLGKRQLHQRVMLGRGPVLPSAIYPLLARGALGRKAELNVFDPLSLRQRIVTFEVVGREELELAGERFTAVHVRQDFTGLSADLWLDERGRVLKEQLPFGAHTRHEAWSE